MKLTLVAGDSKDIQEITYNFVTREVKFELVDGNHFYNLLKGREVTIETPCSSDDYIIKELSFTEEDEGFNHLKIYQITAQQRDHFYRVEAEALKEIGEAARRNKRANINKVASMTTEQLEDYYNGKS